MRLHHSDHIEPMQEQGSVGCVPKPLSKETRIVTVGLDALQQHEITAYTRPSQFMIIA
jgi:hypothetical protein